jgi:hypothetical protein
MAKRTDKTDRAKSSRDIKSPEKINVMKMHKRGLRYTFPIFTAIAGTLTLMSAFAPRAEAVVGGLQYYFDFNLEANNTSLSSTSLNSRATGSFGGTFPTNGANATATQLFNGRTDLVNSGFNGMGAGAGATIQNGGSTVNLFDADTAGKALRLRANSTVTTDINCFTIGPMDFTGLEDISISFALKGGGTKGFQTLTLAYSFDNITFSSPFKTIGGVGGLPSTYTLESANLPAATNGASTLYISFCFTGASDNGVSTATFIDNIQITARIPEPTTAATGVLAVLAVFGLCWSQRRRLIESLRFRRT